MCLTPIEQTSYEFHANRNKEKRIRETRELHDRNDAIQEHCKRG